MISSSASRAEHITRSRALSDRLPALLIEADRVARTVAQGVHGRRRIGVGETFWEYRPYRQEDPASRIDWRQSGKSDRLFVRENEWEAAQTMLLWFDRSPSMKYRSSKALPFKIDRGLLISLALCSLVLRASERVQLLSSRSSQIATHERHLERLAEDLMPEDEAFETAVPIREVAQRSDLVLISDFFDEFSLLEETIIYYADQHVHGTLLQVLDPAEEEFPFDGRTLFRNPEADDTYLAERAQSIKSDYQERLSVLQSSLSALCQKVGWRFHVHRTDRSPNLALLALYQSMSAKSEHTAKRGSSLL